METKWCAPRGKEVPVEDCVSSCADPSARMACWNGRVAPSFEEELLPRYVERKLAEDLVSGDLTVNEARRIGSELP